MYIAVFTLQLLDNPRPFHMSTVHSYSETRHRYWNGYMLFYEATSNQKPQGSPRGGPRGLFIRQDGSVDGLRLVGQVDCG